MTEAPDRAKEFNRGSDARIAGKPESACPHRVTDCCMPNPLYHAWMSGWRHADYHWGKGTSRAARPLPAVRDVA